MARNSMYRLFKSSWGIYIEITAEAISMTNYTDQMMHVTEDLFLSIEVPPYLNETEQQYLARGLQLVADEIRAHNTGKLPLVIHVQKLDFRPSDFQAEGLACALAQWAAEEFGFRAPEVPVTFDRLQNRYEFHFDRVEGQR